MKLKFLLAVVLSFPFLWGCTDCEAKKISDPEHVQQLLATKHCPKCDLSGVNLSGSNMRAAKLMSANLFGANLSGADLSRADLQQATYDDETVWTEAIYDEETNFPEGFDPVAKGMRFEPSDKK